MGVERLLCFIYVCIMKRIDGWVNMIPTFLGWRLWFFLLLVDVDFLAGPLKVSGVGIDNGSNCNWRLRQCSNEVSLCLRVWYMACVNIVGTVTGW